MLQLKLCSDAHYKVWARRRMVFERLQCDNRYECINVLWCHTPLCFALVILVFISFTHKSHKAFILQIDLSASTSRFDNIAYFFLGTCVSSFYSIIFFFFSTPYQIYPAITEITRGQKENLRIKVYLCKKKSVSEFVIRKRNDFRTSNVQKKSAV